MTASIPRSSRISVRTRGCCSSTTLGEKNASVANPPHKRRAGPSRRSSRHFRRESPAHQPCGGFATSPALRPSRIPRSSAVRGVADVLLGKLVAIPPHTGRAGPSRHPSRPGCRESSADPPCGSLATFFSALPSRNPSTPAVRGRRDIPSAPHAMPVLCQFVRICLNSLKSSTLLAGSPMQATLGKDSYENRHRI